MVVGYWVWFTRMGIPGSQFVEKKDARDCREACAFVSDDATIQPTAVQEAYATVERKPRGEVKFRSY